MATSYSGFIFHIDERERARRIHEWVSGYMLPWNGGDSDIPVNGLVNSRRPYLNARQLFRRSNLRYVAMSVPTRAGWPSALNARQTTKTSVTDRL